MSKDTEHVNLAHARAKHQRETMERIIRDGVCPFCRENFEKYHTKPILHETDHWVLTDNFAPYEGAKVHLLLVAKQHCTLPGELAQEAWLDLQSMLEYIRRTYEMPGATVVMRWGDTNFTAASVAHLHAQLVHGSNRKEGGEPILTALGYQPSDEPTRASPE